MKAIQQQWSVWVKGTIMSTLASTLLVLHATEHLQASTHEDERNTSPIVDLEAFTVYGTGMALPTIKYPGSVQVISAEDLSFRNDIIQSLSHIMGFETGNDNGRTIGQQFSIRGFGYQSEDRVIIAMDGVRRSTSLYSNQVSSFRVDSDILKEVEVVKGASSIFHGGGSIGGVVGMTSKSAEDYLLPGKEFGAEIGLRFETNDLKSAHVGAAWAPSGKLPDILVYVKAAEKGNLKLAKKLEASDGSFFDTVDNDESLRTYFLKSNWDFAEDHRVALSYMKYTADTAVTWQSLFHASYKSTTGPVEGELNQDDWVAQYQWNPAANDWVDFNFNLFHADSSYARGWAYENDSGATDELFYENMDSRWGFRGQNLIRFDTGPVRHRLLVGFDYQNREEDAVYVRNGVFTEFGSMPNSYNDIGIFVQEEAAFLDDSLLFQIGGRFDSFRRSVDGGAQKYSNSNFSPRFGLSYEVKDGLYALANYSESFRAPTPHETSSYGPLNVHYYYLPNPDLKPERIRELELGFAFERRGWFTPEDHFRTKLMGFKGKIVDLIKLEPDFDGETPPTSNYYATYLNIDEVEREGFELEVSYSQPRWTFSMSYEVLDQKDRATGHKTPFAFADKLMASIGVKPISPEWMTWVSIEHWFAPDQNPETLVSGGLTYQYVDDPYTHLHAGLTWIPRQTGFDWIDGTTRLQIGVNNILDQHRINASNVKTSSRVGLGRNIWVSLTKAF